MDFLKLGEQKYPVVFNVNSLTDFFDDVGINIFSGESIPMSLRTIRSIVFRGIQEGCRRKGLSLEFNAYDIGDILEENFGDAPDFIEAFNVALPLITEKIIASQEKINGRSATKGN